MPGGSGWLERRDLGFDVCIGGQYLAFLDGLGIGTRYPLGLAIHRINDSILVYHPVVIDMDIF